MTTRCLIFVVVANAWAASTWPSHVTWTVVLVDVGHVLPLGTAPSLTVNVRVTVPGVEHVKFAA